MLTLPRVFGAYITKGPLVLKLPKSLWCLDYQESLVLRLPRCLNYQESLVLRLPRVFGAYITKGPLVSSLVVLASILPSFLPPPLSFHNSSVPAYFPPKVLPD